MVDISCTMVVGGSGSYVAFGGVWGGWRLSRYGRHYAGT